MEEKVPLWKRPCYALPSFTISQVGSIFPPESAYLRLEQFKQRFWKEDVDPNGSDKLSFVHDGQEYEEVYRNLMAEIFHCEEKTGAPKASLLGSTKSIEEYSNEQVDLSGVSIHAIKK
jgi:hypothetical protein